MTAVPFSRGAFGADIMLGLWIHLRVNINEKATLLKHVVGRVLALRRTHL